MKPSPLLALFTIAAALLVGCKSTGFEQIGADGTRTKFRDTRFFTATGAEYESTVSTNGTRSVRARVQSSPQAEAMGAVAEGVARGLKP